MAAFVRETEAGWEVVDGDVVLSTHASHIDALDVALERNGGKTKGALLRDPDTKDLNGAWRWLHATDVEDEPAHDGARIDETTVSQAIASLNSQPLPRPINGGSPDSPAHAPAGDSIATGYAHHAVEVVDSDGRHGAYVIAELVPSVARVVDSGRLAWTSIGLGGSVGDDATIRDAEFDHLALTNTPAVKTLTSSAAIRKPGERFVAVRTHRIGAAARRDPETQMSKYTLRALLASKSIALRGAAIDKVVEIASKLGVTPEEEFSAEQYESPTVAKFCAIRSAAMAEKILETVPAPEAPAARAEMNRAMRHVLGLRAEIADADLEALAKKLGLEAGASMADMIEAAGKMKPAEEPKVEATEADKAKASAADAARSEKMAQLEAQVAALRADKDAREDAEFLDGVLAPRKLAVKAETRARFLTVLRTDRKTGRDVVRDLVAEMHVPPVTRSVGSTGSVDTEVTDASALRVSAIRAEDARIRKEQPTLSEAASYRLAMTNVRASQPDLFRGDAA